MYDQHYTRLNQYRSLWILVFFDLPTETRKERKENAEVHTKRIKNNLPEHGKIGVMQITDKQFGMMELFYGKKPVEAEKPSQQLELF